MQRKLFFLIICVMTVFCGRIAFADNYEEVPNPSTEFPDPPVVTNQNTFAGFDLSTYNRGSGLADGSAWTQVFATTDTNANVWQETGQLPTGGLNTNTSVWTGAGSENLVGDGSQTYVRADIENYGGLRTATTRGIETESHLQTQVTGQSFTNSQGDETGGYSIVDIATHLGVPVNGKPSGSLHYDGTAFSAASSSGENGQGAQASVEAGVTGSGYLNGGTSVKAPAGAGDGQ